MKRWMIIMMAALLLLCSACTAKSGGSGTEPAPDSSPAADATDCPASEAPETPETPETPGTAGAPKETAEETDAAQLTAILDEIHEKVETGTAGSHMTAVQMAAKLLDWGTATELTGEEVRTVTVGWLQMKGNDEETAFAAQLETVRSAYLELLGDNGQALLDSAGVQDTAYPWSDQPVEAIEAVMTAVLGDAE